MPPTADGEQKNYKLERHSMTPIASSRSRFQCTKLHSRFLTPILALALFPSQMLWAEARVIEEVIVTAQKREQSLQDVPVSVSSIGSELIAVAAIDDVQDMVQYTPNVKFSTPNATPVVTIRGFSNGAAGRGLESPVGTVIDEVFYGQTTYVNDGVFDIERMEVLRGPQGALFGKNTIAGVLSFTSKKTSNDWSANIAASDTSLDGNKFEGGINIPLLENKLAARVSFRSNVRDLGSYNTFQQEEYWQQDFSGRIKVDWDISDTLKWSVNNWYHHRDVHGVNRPIILATEQALAEYRSHDPQAEGDGFSERTSTTHHGFFSRRTKVASSKLSWSPTISGLENTEIALIYGYGKTSTPFSFDADYSPIDLLRLDTRGPDIQRQRSWELRFGADNALPFELGELQWLVGIYRQEQISEVSNDLFAKLNGFPDYLQAGAMGVPNNPANPILNLIDFSLIPVDVEERIESFTITAARTEALFGQATWSLNPSWDFTLGLRLGREQKKARIGAQAYGETGIAAAILAAENFDTQEQREENEFSPKAAVSWHASEEITVFANIAKGFKSGGYQPAPVNQQSLSFEPEKALAAELGIKSRLLDGSLQLNATAFIMDFDNLQVINFDGTNFITLNAAEARSTGFELDFVWLPPWQALSIAGSLGTTHARYSSYPCAPVALDGSSTTNPDCPNEGQDLKNKELAFAPAISASLMPSLRFDLIPSWGIRAMIGVDLLYQGDFFLESDLDRNSFQEATTKVNARVGISDARERWSFTFNAKNITGIQEMGAMADQPILPGNYIGFALKDEPLYVSELRYRFGE